MVLSLDCLPEEILHSILCYCPPTCPAALAQTSRRFGSVANDPILWRFYCRVCFKFWSIEHELPKKLESPVSSVNWKALYVTRHLTDRAVTRLVDSFLGTQTGRIEKSQAIIDIGYDAKDTLLRNISVDPGAEDVLARRFALDIYPDELYFNSFGRQKRYYAKALLTCLHRGIAVSEWTGLKSLENAPSLERALGAFDLFVPESGYGDLSEITVALDKIAARLLAATPDIPRLTPRQKAHTIASYLRANGLTGIDRSREYHSLEHNFLGMALKAPEHNSLPLISAAIYCYIALRFGLNARPCGFPFHVHVIVTPPPRFDIDGRELDAADQGAPIYMDPFRSEAETPVSNLRSQLNFLGAADVDQAALLGESSTTDVVLRCGKNILNSVQYVYQFHDLRPVPVDVSSARYAGLWASMLLSSGTRIGELRLFLPWLMELFATEFPWDIQLIEQHLVPLFEGMAEHNHILECLHVMRAADGVPKHVRRRAAGQNGIRYRVGQVFRHRRYNYTGIITGWDAECGAGEEWMLRMGVDRLPSGRHQSFYDVLVEDKSVRYVAEENIEPVSPSMAELPEMLMAIAGKHFKRWDEETRTFVSNIRDEYPDD